MTEQDQSNPSTLIRQSELLHHVALHSTTLEELGRVDVLWMFPQVNRVLGIVVKPGWFGATRLVFKLPQIKAVKAQVLVQGVAEETTLDKVQKLESLIDTEVWTDGGDRLGTITDCLFDLSSGVIIRYLMVPDGQFPQLITQFTDGIYLISPKQIQSFSQHRVLIADETVEHLRLYSEGIRLKLATMTANLKHNYWDDATEEWHSLSHHVQSIAQKAANRVKTLAEKAQLLSKNLAQRVSDTVTDKVEQVEEAIADEDQPWHDPEWIDAVTDTVKTKGQTVVSEVKERSQPVIDRIKTVQQTLQTSVNNHLNARIDAPSNPVVQSQKNGQQRLQNTIDLELDDDRLDNDRLDNDRLDDDWVDDLDWESENVDTANDGTVNNATWEPVAAIRPPQKDCPDHLTTDPWETTDSWESTNPWESADPWDNWDEETDSPQTHSAIDPHEAPNSAKSHSQPQPQVKPHISDPWDTDSPNYL